MKARLNMSQGQQLAMTPQLLQSIRMLQLSNLELEQELREALVANVMLEDAADDSDDDGAPDLAAETVAAAAAEATDCEVTGNDAAALSRVEAEFDWSSADNWSGGEPGNGDDEPWEARMATPEVHDARIAALAQLELVVRTPRQATLVAAILDGIDDNGYLTQPLDGIALESALLPLPDEDELEAALALVQSVEPSGFGARDLRECLQLQLRMLPPQTPGRELADYLVSACLERIAQQDFTGLCESLAIDALQLHQALDLVLALNPKPAAALAAEATAITPDLSVTGRPGMWKVVLNGGRLPQLRVNRRYEQAITQGSGAHKGLKDQLQEARWLVRGLEMRHDTLLRTARAIFERQCAFLEKGEEGMAPLTLREIAEAIGMHESTICRVTSNKWVHTPWGVYELKAFFPSQIGGAEGETSGTAVKAMIRRIINGESSNAPLCDGDITALLARNGVHLARRTVAKYREAMRIPQATQRLEAARPRRAMFGG